MTPKGWQFINLVIAMICAYFQVTEWVIIFTGLIIVQEMREKQDG